MPEMQVEERVLSFYEKGLQIPGAKVPQSMKYGAMKSLG